MHNTSEFVGGAKDGAVEAGKGLGQLGYDVFWGSSPFADEQTRAETRARAQSRKYAITHPKELVEAIVAPYKDDLAEGRTGHAAGRAVFDGLTVIGAGSLGKVGKTAAATERTSIGSARVASSIKSTGVVYEGTAIPKSFELTVGDQTFWVAPNATKHLAERVSGSSSPAAARLASQLQLSSLEGAVSMAVKDGIQMDQLVRVGGWELIFGPAKTGKFPALYHARQYGG